MEDAKEKGTRKVGGVGKSRRERKPVIIYFTTPPTFRVPFFFAPFPLSESLELSLVCFRRSDCGDGAKGCEQENKEGWGGE